MCEGAGADPLLALLDDLNLWRDDGQLRAQWPGLIRELCNRCPHASDAWIDAQIRFFHGWDCDQPPRKRKKLRRSFLLRNIPRKYIAWVEKQIEAPPKAELRTRRVTAPVPGCAKCAGEGWWEEVPESDEHPHGVMAKCSCWRSWERDELQAARKAVADAQEA